MFVNVRPTPARRPTAVGQLGELSRARIILSEFKYNKGPKFWWAGRLHLVVDGAVESQAAPMAAVDRHAFHLIGDIFGLENGAFHRFTAGDRRRPCD
jgi:CRP/FNR family nitrogen fixation transcriptional regulator